VNNVKLIWSYMIPENLRHLYTDIMCVIHVPRCTVSKKHFEHTCFTSRRTFFGKLVTKTHSIYPMSTDGVEYDAVGTFPAGTCSFALFLPRVASGAKVLRESVSIPELAPEESLCSLMRYFRFQYTSMKFAWF